MLMVDVLNKVARLWGSWDSETKSLVSHLIAGFEPKEVVTNVEMHIDGESIKAAFSNLPRIVMELAKKGY